MPSEIKFPTTPIYQFTIVGAGANGSHFFRGLCQDLRTHSNANQNHSEKRYILDHIMLIDGDKVEEKNLGNQLFESEEIGEYKVTCLAERYGSHYDLEVFRHTGYIQDAQQLAELMPVNTSNRGEFIPVIVAMVDNNATRQIVDTYFRDANVQTLIYIDAGVHAIQMERGPGGMAGRVDTGNNGQVVVGFKYRGEIIMEPVTGVYPEILTDTDSRVPGCGAVVESQPQRLMSNKFAAQIANNLVTSLLSERAILIHQVHFDARFCGSRATYVSQAQASAFDHLIGG